MYRIRCCQAFNSSVTATALNINTSIVFEGATADDFETTLTITDPTADRTITLLTQQEFSITRWLIL